MEQLAPTATAVSSSECDFAMERALIPIRAVNAFVFCPRLYWLEYVEGEWAENRHTLEGKQAHRRVDREGGAMPGPKKAGDSQESNPTEVEMWHTRALWLSDLQLGVTGKIDLISWEGDGCVMPVDTKKGRPQRTDDGDIMWPADRVQLVLQALLLRSHGYEVSHIGAWYAGAKKRVVIPLTPEMELEARAAVQQVQALVEEGMSPAPLIEANRCHGCSLQPVCLPDEWNALHLPQDTVSVESSEHAVGANEASASVGTIRRIQVSNDTRLPLYLSESGSRVGVSAGSLRIKPRKDLEEAGHKPIKVGLGQISQVNVMGGVQITTQALQTCLKSEIPVSFFSSGGWFYGRAMGVENRQVHVRMAQFSIHGKEEALAIARTLIADKIHNCRVLLRRNASDCDGVTQVLMRLKRLVGRALETDHSSSLLGIEGEAAKLYWGFFGEMVRRKDDVFAMQGRNRRPPRDPTNALLSYGYALLCKELLLAVSSVGLDPYLGVFHQPHHGNPGMALDLMEPFRPLIVDSVVHSMIRRGEVREGDFVFSGTSVGMKSRAKKALISAYERRIEEQVIHPVFGYRMSYRRILYVQARLLTRVLLGELSSMPSFRTR